MNYGLKGTLPLHIDGHEAGVKYSPAHAVDVDAKDTLGLTVFRDAIAGPSYIYRIALKTAAMKVLSLTKTREYMKLKIVFELFVFWWRIAGTTIFS